MKADQDQALTVLLFSVTGAIAFFYLLVRFVEYAGSLDLFGIYR